MHGPEPGKGSFYIELDLTNLLRPKNKGGGPKPCFMVGCLSRGGSLKYLGLDGSQLFRKSQKYVAKRPKNGRNLNLQESKFTDPNFLFQHMNMV